MAFNDLNPFRSLRPFLLDNNNSDDNSNDNDDDGNSQKQDFLLQMHAPSILFSQNRFLTLIDYNQ
jgi:hypothetical protein